MAMDMERSFEVDTPLGKLKVYAKQEDDVPENFPGVYIDLIRAESNDAVLLACVEYESAKQVIQTCVYGDGLTDEPTNVVEHQNLTEQEDDL